MNTSSTSEILQRRTPENLILQRTASHDSRGACYPMSYPFGRLKLTCVPLPASAFSIISPLTPSTDSPVSPDNWQGYPTQSQVPPKPLSRPSSSTIPSAMIGPTSSYYDPEQAMPQDAPDYQRWVDAYGTGPINYGDQNVPALAQSQFQQHHRQARPPMQNQYQFVPNQYNPAPTSDQHYRPTQGIPRQPPPQHPQSPSSEYPPPVSGRQTGMQNYSQPIDSNMFFYPPTSMGVSQPAYNNTFSGSHQPQQTYSSPTADPSFTPTSDLHTLPAHQSVSPPWSEERLPQTQTTLPQRPVPRRPANAKPTPTKQPGSAKKPLAGRKRPRKSGAGDDSDSESDEDPSLDARGGDGHQSTTRL